MFTNPQFGTVVLAEPGETVDEHLEEALKNVGVDVKPVVELPNGDFIHGYDEELTPEQHEQLFGHGRDKRLTIRAAAARDVSWPGGIVPYTFKSFGRTKMVTSAMRELARGTCIQFKKRKTEKNYIQFVRKDGCHSKLGMWKKGKQDISLELRGCMYRDTVLHEILHALGIIHEQERPDRAEHMSIEWDNLSSRGKAAFDRPDRKNIRYYGVPYDFASIMHYSLRSFSKDRKNLFSMIPLKKPDAWKYAERKRDYGLSFGDYKLVNRMYDCGAKCDIDCPEPGYVTKECECMTQKRFYKENCKGEEEAGWCLKFRLEGDTEDFLGPDPEPTTTQAPTEEPIDPDCMDTYSGCKNFAKKGYCVEGHANYAFVSSRCPKSCKKC